jgi:hypothetical protein
MPVAGEEGEWVEFGDKAIGKLDQANDSKETVLWIYDRCEAEKQKAVEALQPRSIWDRLAFWR